MLLRTMRLNFQIESTSTVLTPPSGCSKGLLLIVPAQPQWLGLFAYYSHIPGIVSQGIKNPVLYNLRSDVSE